MTYLLSLVTFLPLLGAFVLGVFVRPDSLNSDKNAKTVALFSSCATFIISLTILMKFDYSITDFQLVEDYNWLFGLNYKMGVDGISLLFIILTTAIMPLVFLASWNISFRVKEYMIAFLVLETFMIGVFCALDLIMFYISCSPLSQK